MHVFAPRHCGRGSLVRWHRAALGLLVRLPMEAWLASVVGLMAISRACETLPGLWPLAVLLGMMAGRGAWDLAGGLLGHHQANDGARNAPAGGAVMWSLAAFLLALGAGAWSALVGTPPSPSAWMSPFHAWVLACWMAWLLRPWGPVGFIGPLRRSGCPPMACFHMQAAAFRANPLALIGLGVAWLAGLLLLLLCPLLVVAGVWFWPLVLRCAYADIFEGGLRPAPAPARPMGLEVP